MKFKSRWRFVVYDLISQVLVGPNFMITSLFHDFVSAAFITSFITCCFTCLTR
jgi:hypothetical protein